MQGGREPCGGTHSGGKGGSTAERYPTIPRRGTPQVAEPQQADSEEKKPKLNHHYLTSDYETENTHTAGSRTFEQATTEIDRRTKGIRFPPLLQALRHQRADGTNICTECGHSWKSDHDLADTVCGCTCPHCGMELEALRTRKSVFSDMEYFSIVTTCKRYQVIRFFSVKSRYKAGQPAEYSIFEVVQRWIAPTARQRPLPDAWHVHIYYDLWNEYSDMEVRKNTDAPM